MKLKNVHVVDRGRDRYVLVGSTDSFLVSLNTYGIDVLSRMLGKEDNQLSEEELFLYDKISNAGHLEEGTGKLIVKKGIEVVSVETTDMCNLSCEHCHLGEKNNDTISIEKLEELVEDEIVLGGYQFDITGGEPFMDKQIYDKLAMLRANDLRVTITTNGMAINPKRAQNLKDLEIAEIHVTINGFKEEHEGLYGQNTFEKAMRGFQSMVDAGLDIVVNYCAYPGNLDSVDRFSDYIIEQGALSIDVSTIIPLGWAQGKKSLLLSEKAYKEFMLKYNGSAACEAKEFSKIGIPCGAITKGVYIQANGDVLPCKLFKDRAIGNIYESRLIDMYENPNKNFLQITEFDTDKLADCNSCEQYSSCGGGCRARAEEMDDIYAPDRLSCVIRK